MHNQELSHIADRYLKGEATAAEQALLEDWFAATEKDPVDLSEKALQAIKADMLTNIRDQAAYLPVPDEMNETPVRRLWPALQRIAVIIALIAGIYGMFYLHSLPLKNLPVAADRPVPAATGKQYRMTAAATTQVRRIILPDSSVVTLNRSGSLHYHLPFGDKNREVYLDAGEAFFEIKKNATKPFLVYAGKTATSVLGTSFNIRMNHPGNTVRVVVKTGKVKVAADLHGLDSAKLITPDHGIEINTANNKTHTFSQSADIAISWCRGTLVFRQHILPEVVMALESKYQVHIRLMTPALERYRVSGDFSANHTVTEVLDALCLVHRLTYKKKGDNYFIY
ncbi:FecR domain-containing protein [Chitinophaga sp. MM2321]|uniref:FecR family protein n=1 Tax=Chitinophaga sp. MM2321 TaxID=3137178 RepID=UPI0032D5AC90